MTVASRPYPIGRPGVPWGEAERAEWLSRQVRQRSYADDVTSAIERLSARFDMAEYGRLDYPPDHYRLFAIRNRGWRDERPVVLVTGGVHGYETSGVHGALQFVEHRAADYAGRINLLVAPCVSPWAYERIHRWNPHAIDPNRSFREDSPAGESAALMRLIAPLRGRFLLHIDLHETTDTDESEFRPALAARDGETVRAGCHSGRLLPRRRQRKPATAVPAGSDRSRCQGHAYCPRRCQRPDHRIGHRGTRRHSVRDATARPVRWHHGRALHDDD